MKRCLLLGRKAMTNLAVVLQLLRCVWHLRPHGLQQLRVLCPSLFPRAHSNSCSLSQWCHPTILSSVVLFFSCFQSSPASWSFLVSASRIRWPKYWSSSLKISPSNEYSGVTSFRIDWLDLLVAQSTLKSLLWHHSSKASILQHSDFFMVQISHSYKTTGNKTKQNKHIPLTRWTFVGKVTSLLFDMLSRCVIAFLP